MRSWQKGASERSRYAGKLTVLVMLWIWWLVCPMKVQAGTVFDSPYVEITEDGGAWTTCKGETHKQYYDKGYVLETGITSSLRLLEEGEHYYSYDRTGSIPIGRWIVEHMFSFCIHSSYPEEGEDFHGITYNRSSCGRPYCQGWIAYCADCEEKIINLLMYMCDNAVKSIHYLETGMDYYYLCPYCSNLEQARLIAPHTCKGISKNQYRVVYHVNTQEYFMGVMADSYHLYDNATYYNGENILPQTTLSPLKYTVPGYSFIGWNTSADGSGAWYEDEAPITNLTPYDCNEDGVWGEVTLYAQWTKNGSSTLIIDPGTGMYMGQEGEQRFHCSQGTVMTLDRLLIEPPYGVKVSFESNGGEPIDPIFSYGYFSGWDPQEPFYGTLEGDTYVFPDSDGITDRIRICYDFQSILLPVPIRENYIFMGWYLDQELCNPVPTIDGFYYPRQYITLYAKWEQVPPEESVSRGLESRVQRMLSPHEPVFQKGESGVLTVRAWGHPKTLTIEFPEMLQEYNVHKTYGESSFEQTEQIEFMIPLYDVAEMEYQIYVSATYPEGSDRVINTIKVSGTILNELRTRLR